MLSSFETRQGTALREEIQEEMGQFIAALDNIRVDSTEAVALRFVQELTRYTTLEEVLGMLDAIQERLASE